jgi:MFS family permease
VTLIFTRYRTFLALPDVKLLLATALLTRLPISTVGFAMLMHVRSLFGSFSVAGAAVGAYLAASAAMAPVFGRMIDRHGPRPTLLITGVVGPVALLLVLGAGWLELPEIALVAGAAFAGVFVPPITVLTRTMWRYRFDDDDARQIAFSADSVLIELTFTVGPALVALLLAVTTPFIAFAAAWFFALIAVPVFLASPALKYWVHDPDADRHLLGPLTESRLLIVYAATFLLTLSFGLVEVGYPAFATSAGMPAYGGVLLAINSIGSAVGGLAYGGSHFKLPIERQLPIVFLLVAAPFAVQALIASPSGLAVAALFAGLCVAPSLTILTLLVSLNAPSRYAAEAFTWSSTCIVSGLGVGNAIGGRLVESHGASAAFATSAAVIVGAALLATQVRSRLPVAA